MQDKNKNMKTQYEIEVFAGKIHNNMQRLTKIWAELDYFHEHGRLTPDKGLTLQRQIREMEIGEILTLYDNLPPLITRWKQKLKNMPEGPNKESLKLNLALKESELRAIKALKDESV
jgi:hypothetical protein